MEIQTDPAPAPSASRRWPRLTRRAVHEWAQRIFFYDAALLPAAIPLAFDAPVAVTAAVWLAGVALAACGLRVGAYEKFRAKYMVVPDAAPSWLLKEPELSPTHCRSCHTITSPAGVRRDGALFFGLMALTMTLSAALSLVDRAFISGLMIWPMLIPVFGWMWDRRAVHFTDAGVVVHGRGEVRLIRWEHALALETAAWDMHLRCTDGTPLGRLTIASTAERTQVVVPLINGAVRAELRKRLPAERYLQPAEIATASAS